MVMMKFVCVVVYHFHGCYSNHPSYFIYRFLYCLQDEYRLLSLVHRLYSIVTTLFIVIYFIVLVVFYYSFFLTVQEVIA